VPFVERLFFGIPQLATLHKSGSLERTAFRAFLFPFQRYYFLYNTLTFNELATARSLFFVCSLHLKKQIRTDGKEEKG
jgi:hypothetical protein